jgi:hypothetical protein
MNTDSPLATLDERDPALIQKHLNFFEALHFGSREPDTDAQRHFVDVFACKAEPETDHELAYMRYLCLGLSLDELEAETEQVDQGRPWNTSDTIEFALPSSSTNVRLLCWGWFSCSRRI